MQKQYRASPERRGSIINISSVGSTLGLPEDLAYASSKGVAPVDMHDWLLHMLHDWLLHMAFGSDTFCFAGGVNNMTRCILAGHCKMLSGMQPA